MHSTIEKRSIFEGEDFFEESDFQWRPRSFAATVNYRINKKKYIRTKWQFNGESDEF